MCATVRGFRVGVHALWTAAKCGLYLMLHRREVGGPREWQVGLFSGICRIFPGLAVGPLSEGGLVLYCYHYPSRGLLCKKEWDV